MHAKPSEKFCLLLLAGRVPVVTGNQIIIHQKVSLVSYTIINGSDSQAGREFEKQFGVPTPFREERSAHGRRYCWKQELFSNVHG